MAKKSVAAKAAPKSKRLGQKSTMPSGKTPEGAHGGGVKYGIVKLGSGFDVNPKVGTNNISPRTGYGKQAAAKLPKASSGFVRNISEGTVMSRPSVVFGRGFGTNPFIVAEAKSRTSSKKKSSSGSKWSQKALENADKPPSRGGTKGSLRRALGKKGNQKITRSELRKTIDSPKTSPKVKQKALAIYNLGGGKKGKKGR